MKEESGCYCHTLNTPPCSYCEGVTVCEYCGRVLIEVQEDDGDYVLICEDCCEGED